MVQDLRKGSDIVGARGVSVIVVGIAVRVNLFVVGVVVVDCVCMTSCVVSRVLCLMLLW